MSIQETDAASRAVAKNDNRISMAFIESQIAWKHISSAGAVTSDSRFPHQNASIPSPEVCERLLAVTICTLVMKNGFVIIGKSAPLDPENFNAELGQKFAYEDCIRQLWPLYAFAKLEISLAERSM